MSDDTGRYFVVTEFVCSECGRNLTVTKDEPKEFVESYNRPDDGITGGSQLPVRIVIRPCRYCIERQIRPAKLITDGIKELLKQ